MIMEVRIVKDEPYELSLELVDGEHSLLQMLVEKLNKEKSVDFAASKVTHPLVANPVFTIRTKRVKAKELVMKKLEEMKKEVEGFDAKFSDISG
jgi:DNA-directed RNA polymerase subunit L